jgi:hypothetical protein
MREVFRILYTATCGRQFRPTAMTHIVTSGSRLKMRTGHADALKGITGNSSSGLGGYDSVRHRARERPKQRGRARMAVLAC